jgi:hypothetical protein
MKLYIKNLKNREFDKEDSHNFCLEQELIADTQVSIEDKNFEAKLTPLKTNSSGCLSIKENFSSLLKIQLISSTLLIVLLLFGLLYLQKELRLVKEEANGYRRFFEDYKREKDSQPLSNANRNK